MHTLMKLELAPRASVLMLLRVGGNSASFLDLFYGSINEIKQPTIIREKLVEQRTRMAIIVPNVRV